MLQASMCLHTQGVGHEKTSTTVFVLYKKDRIIFQKEGKLFLIKTKIV